MKEEISMTGTPKLLRLLRGLADGKLVYKTINNGGEADKLRYMRKYKIVGIICENS